MKEVDLAIQQAVYFIRYFKQLIVNSQHKVNKFKFVVTGESLLDDEVAVDLGQILRLLHWSKTKFYSRRKELMDAGAIFYQFEGRPPKWRVRAFPSRLKNWTGLKASKGEPL